MWSHIIFTKTPWRIYYYCSLEDWKTEDKWLAQDDGTFKEQDWGSYPGLFGSKAEDYSLSHADLSGL